MQEACISIYDGYYSINRILNAILYCCESLNPHIYNYENESKEKKNGEQGEGNGEEQQRREETRQETETQLQTDYETHVVPALSFVHDF